jgi:undecaprenyl-phosphate galactose phosphotransferase
MKELTAEKVWAVTSEKTYLFIKRLIDIIGGLVGLILLIPISIIIKILTIATGDFNSIFFSQKRIGKDGKEFNFYKFRSMVPNADKILFEMLEKDPEMAKEYKENKKLKNDPRITKVGHFIRRTSIDELPQLLNVLKGDMSLVGNRPYLPREKEDMGSFFHDIVKTRPGLTGYWQVSDRKDVSFLHRLKLEQYYSNNRSMSLDIKILFKTVKAVIFGHGAAE